MLWLDRVQLALEQLPRIGNVLLGICDLAIDAFEGFIQYGDNALLLDERGEGNFEVPKSSIA